jgi:flagellar biosynthesis/type III secretory pathway chaperone
MKLSDKQRKQLTLLFFTELAGVRNLLHCLKQEYEALAGGDPDSIAECVARKRDLMQPVQQNLVDRTNFIRSELGKMADADDFSTRIQALETSDPLAGQWQLLQELSMKLQEQNDINGKIISFGQQHARHSLDILTGCSAYDHTYGPRGNRSQERQSHTLAKA